jgi:hypothetical protein
MSQPKKTKGASAEIDNGLSGAGSIIGRLPPYFRKGFALIKSDYEELHPQPSPGRGKRSQRPIEEHMVFVDAVGSFCEGRPTADLMSAIEDGFADPGSRVFDVILEAKSHLESLGHTTFSRSVIEARRAWVSLSHRLGRRPTKAEVVAEVREKFGDGAFEPEASSRWSEVFKAAGIADELDTAKPKRGKSRRG